MSHSDDGYVRALAAAVRHSTAWLRSLPGRPVGPAVAAHDLTEAFGGPLPKAGMPAEDVVDVLARTAEPGLMAMPSGRFFGWVIGGTLPAALASDWLVSAWCQNAGLRYAIPAMAAIEESAGNWLLELLGRPSGADVGFVTGATMANFTGMAAARWRLLADADRDLDSDGLFGAPPNPWTRYWLKALAPRWSGCRRGTSIRALLILSPKQSAWPGSTARMGACGRRVPPWAAAAPGLRSLIRGYEDADSWGTDAHKSLNVPYDCGIAIVPDASALRSVMGLHARYPVHDAEGPRCAWRSATTPPPVQ